MMIFVMQRAVPRLFGARVKALRLERGLSVQHLAAALGCDLTVIYHIERGRHGISFLRLQQLDAVLHVYALDLFTFAGETPRHDLIELTRKATPEAVQKLCELALRGTKAPR